MTDTDRLARLTQIVLTLWNRKTRRCESSYATAPGVLARWNGDTKETVHCTCDTCNAARLVEELEREQP